jgi:crotonobetaine/carnitine-CoA ligase
MAELTLHDIFDGTRQAVPDKPCLAESALSGGRVWSYAQVGHEVDKLVTQYRKWGWGAGHRVALGVGNHPRHFFHFLALNSLGASIVPLNPDYRLGEIRYALHLTRADLVVCHPQLEPLLLQAIGADEGLKDTHLVSLDEFDAHLPSPRYLARANVSPLSAEVAILFTSGTSGRPKGCVLTNEYILGAAKWYRDMGGLLTWKTGTDKLLNPLPVFHMNCSMVSFPTMCITQNCLVLPDRFHANQWWEDCVKSGATAIHYLGVMPPALFKQPFSDWETQHQIRFGLGAGCDPTLHGPFEDRFKLPLIEVWGMTETGRFLGNHHDPRQTNTRAFGRVQAPLQVRVTDDADNSVATGSSGELLVKAQGDNPRQGFFSGYLHDEEATEQSWRGDWFHTGDVVYQDPTGMLFFVDRKKDMVRRSGENISSAEVEAVLAIHPMVLRVAIVPVKDELRDEEVMAVVIPMPGSPVTQIAANDLVSYCLQELAYYKAPGWVLFRQDLPTTPTNKIQKNLIFEAHQNPLAGAWDCRGMKKRA